jgi:hypothetical protein
MKKRNQSVSLCEIIPRNVFKFDFHFKFKVQVFRFEFWRSVGLTPKAVDTGIDARAAARRGRDCDLRAGSFFARKRPGVGASHKRRRATFYFPDEP